MFKRIFFKAVVLTLVATSFCSCNKYLDLRPENGITADKFWTTKEDLQAAVIGVYSAVNPVVERAFIWGEIRADFIEPTPFASAAETDVVANNILPTNPISDWTALYRVINLCNLVLEFGPQVKERDRTLTQEQLNGYLGEVYTIRALMYFYLVRTFGDVPLTTTAVASDDDIVMLPKSSKEDVLKQIVADLNTAEGLAVSTYGNVNFDKGRITKWTVNAIQADVYLWMDRFEDCIAACDKIKNSGRFALVEGDDSWYGELYVQGNSVESIFEYQFDLQPTNLNPFHFMLHASNRRFNANPIILDTYYTVDPDNENNKDIRGIGVALNAADGTIYKYYVSSPEQSGRHWIFYRYADILLMQAEAYAHTGRGQDALDIINLIRQRAKALPGSVQNPGPTDVNGLVDYILAERGRELAFEGKRWFDLLRNAKRNNFARLDILQKAAQVSVPAVFQEAAINKMKDPNSLYLPILFSELQRNRNLVQNPFYK